MPFKVVQTIERGKSFISCVPDKWESNGVLYWPKNKAEKLSKKENSQPDEDWISIPCKLKRDNLTYDEAQLQINIMSEHTDTEEEMPNINYKRSKVQMKMDVSFNDMAKKCVLNLNDNKVQVKESATKSDPLDEEVAFQDVFIPLVEAEQPTSPPQVVLEDSNCDKYYIVNTTQEKTEDSDSLKLDNLTAAVAEIKETQQHILLGLAGISTQIEEFFKRSNINQLKDKVQFEPINDLESFQKLEDDLKHDARGELKQRLSVVCGSGKGRGANNCFALVDVMFNRQFLTKCSWAGGSRNESKKICFKAFTGVIQLFFSIIHDSDNTFTLLECETFFKNILRNSVRRNSAKLLRASTTKLRKAKKNKDINVSNETAGFSAQEMQKSTPSQPLNSVPPNKNQDSSEN